MWIPVWNLEQPTVFKLNVVHFILSSVLFFVSRVDLTRSLTWLTSHQFSNLLKLTPLMYCIQANSQSTVPGKDPRCVHISRLTSLSSLALINHVHLRFLLPLSPSPPWLLNHLNQTKFDLKLPCHAFRCHPLNKPPNATYNLWYRFYFNQHKPQTNLKSTSNANIDYVKLGPTSFAQRED